MDNLEKFCDDDFIHISPESWKQILDYIGDDKERRLKVTTQLAVLAGRYPLPVPEITWDEVTNDYKKFCETRINAIVTDMPVRGEPYKYPISDYALEWSTAGGTVVDKFFYESQLYARHRRYRSPAEAWMDVSGRRTSFNALVCLKKSHVDKKMVLQGFKLRLYMVHNFRPTVAREIYDSFGGDVVLDFSSGYGGRFLGFWGSKCSHYIGIDPNSMLRRPYADIAAWLRANDDRSKTFKFIESPAEDVNYSQFSDVDLVFTSPPYFDLERYSTEDTQSWKKYKNISSWKDNFLFKTLQNVYPSVRKGGHIIVNIADTPRLDLTVCDDMCDFAKEKLHMEIIPGRKLMLTNRPGANHKHRPGTAKIAEPLWVFKKK